MKLINRWINSEKGKKKRKKVMWREDRKRKEKVRPRKKTCWVKYPASNFKVSVVSEWRVSGFS